MPLTYAELERPIPDTPPKGPSAVFWLLGAILIAAVLAIGIPGLKSPWILGDERIFIINNPDVTGDAPSEPTGFRLIDIFLHSHEDLYQPITILSYAIQWTIGGEQRVLHIRLLDVLIHAVNGLLLWSVLLALFRRLFQEGNDTLGLVAWALAFIWTMHPMLVETFAADMGRTHLLATTFTFIALLLHLKSLQPGGWPWFIFTLFALLLAMLNKPVVGWVVIIFALEWMLLGLRRTLTSPRVYLIGLMCTGFAILTLQTTRETFMLEEAELPLFGDPIARAMLGLWIYLCNFAVPVVWQSPLYLPDINIGWTHPAVWAGTIAALIAIGISLLALRNRRWHGVTLGLIWACAMWLPISGIIGARVVAARDRYMYLPMAGLLFALGIVILHWIRNKPETSKTRGTAILIVALVLGCAALPFDRTICRDSRSTLARGEQTAAIYPEDPRAQEYLAVTYDFCRDHVIPEGPPPEPYHYWKLMGGALSKAAELAELGPEYFPDDRTRAEFHRRLSVTFWRINLYEDSLRQAQRAADFAPEAPETWTRLAHSYRSLERWDDALRAYEKLAEIMPADAPNRDLRLVEHGDLLLRRFDDPVHALEKFRAALDLADLDPTAQREAILGAARCEVLAGKGSDGYELAMLVLRNETDNPAAEVEAAKIIALYYLRSHEWDNAEQFYREILKRAPTDYEALRGFQNLCVNNGNWTDAAFAWQTARELAPQDPIFHAHFVWSAACTGETKAKEWADEILETASDNRFACLAHMLLTIRAGDYESALKWIEQARHGPKLPLAREFSRAEATLRTMIAREELPPEAVLAQAMLWLEIGSVKQGRQLVEQFLDKHPDSPRHALAEEILRQKLPPETAP